MTNVIRQFPHLSSSVDNWDLNRVVAELRQARLHSRAQLGQTGIRRSYELPSKDALGDIVKELVGALFPRRLGPADLQEENEDQYVGHRLDISLHALRRQVRLELIYSAYQQHQGPDDDIHSREALEWQATEVVRKLAFSLPQLRRVLDADLLAGYQGDPAARSIDEILLCYPGIVAISHYRIARELHVAGVPLVARIITEIAHSETGIDIHPGAQIGEGFFIDHGTGVVIGETTIIGRWVRLYQAVTLGAKRFPVSADGTLVKGQPRHPIVEDDVVIYAGATLLGRITIGRGSTIGGNVWLTQSVVPGSVITQADNHSELVSEGLGI
jgi:serine O-acetyltransferase